MRAPVVVVSVVTVVVALGCGGMPVIEVHMPDSSADAPAPVRREVTVAEKASGGTPSTGTTSTKTTSSKSSTSKKSSSSSKAKTGEISVATAAAVMVYVDGYPASFDLGKGAYIVGNLAPGEHSLEVMNALGKTVATDTVTVQGGKSVRKRYRTGGELTEIGVVDVVEEPVVEVAAAAYVPPAAGSVQISGLTSGDAVWVDGYQLPWSSASDSFYASNLAPGTHTLRVEGGGTVVYDGAVDVADAQNHRCIADYDWGTSTWRIDCHWTRPAL